MPGRNNTEDKLEQRLFNKVAELERALRALTTPQAVGADVLETVAVPGLGDPPILVGPINLVANSYLNTQIVMTPSLTKVQNATLVPSFYVDTYDAAHHFPDGSSLTSGQKNFRVVFWDDLAGLNLSTGIHTFTMILENFDSIAHSYYVAARFLAPKGSIQ